MPAARRTQRVLQFGEIMDQAKINSCVQASYLDFTCTQSPGSGPLSSVTGK